MAIATYFTYLRRKMSNNFHLISIDYFNIWSDTEETVRQGWFDVSETLSLPAVTLYSSNVM